MGAWGEESCSNDHCLDNLLAEDIGNITQREAEESLAVSLESLDNNPCDIYDAKAFLGVVIWCLDHGCQVAENYLQRGIRVAELMLSNPEYFDRWRDPAQRERCLHDEVAIIQHALAHDGKSDRRDIPGLMDKMDEMITGE